jgi:hypothetical protein
MESYNKQHRGKSLVEQHEDKIKAQKKQVFIILILFSSFVDVIKLN